MSDNTRARAAAEALVLAWANEDTYVGGEPSKREMDRLTARIVTYVADAVAHAVKEPCEVCAHVKGAQMTGPKTPSQIRYERELHEQAEEIAQLNRENKDKDEEIANWKENFQEMMESNTQHWEALGRVDEEIARLRAALMDIADALGCNKHPEGHVERAKDAAREALRAAGEGGETKCTGS